MSRRTTFQKQGSIAAYGDWTGRLQASDHPAKQKREETSEVESDSDGQHEDLEYNAENAHKEENNHKQLEDVPDLRQQFRNNQQSSVIAYEEWTERLRPNDMKKDDKQDHEMGEESEKESKSAIGTVGRNRSCYYLILSILIDIYQTLMGTMPRWHSLLEDTRKRNRIAAILIWPLIFVDSCLRGIAQVMYLNNPISGLVILAAMFYCGTYGATCILVATACGTLLAFLMGLNYAAIRSGLFSFNSVLVGSSLALFLQPSYRWQAYVVSAILGPVSTIIHLAMGNLLVPKWGVPPFTFPFNITATIFFLGSYQYSYFSTQFIPSLPAHVKYEFKISAEIVVKGWLRGISQVYLCDNWISAIIMLPGIALCSPIAAIFCMIGSFTGLTFAYLVGVNPAEIEQGLWGYNSVLGTMAIGGFFYRLTWRTFLLSIFCGILCALIFGAVKVFFLPWGIPSLTFPFVLAAWVFVFTQGSIANVVPIDVTLITTPEGAIRRYFSQKKKTAEMIRLENEAKARKRRKKRQERRKQREQTLLRRDTTKTFL